jgi:hypothetical protein
MSSLWTDLLFLRGHIADVWLARRLAGEPPAEAPPEEERRTPAVEPRRLPWPLRLCMGIGDGVVHTQ